MNGSLGLTELFETYVIETCRPKPPNTSSH